ncbi:MAG: hypothetical protein V4563_14485 [Pseudomonadota bacterium]
MLHQCDNPRCVRPDHLFLGDDLANSRDSHLKGRASVLGMAKLSRADTTKIRKANATFRKVLAAHYGVDVTLICRIINRRRWAHSHKR